MSRLDPLCADDCPGCERSEIASLRAAVESVLALHREETGTYHNWIGPNDPKVMLEASKDPRRSPHLYEKVTYQRCRECYNRGDCRGHFPCPTVQAIQSALGEEEK